MTRLAAVLSALCLFPVVWAGGAHAGAPQPWQLGLQPPASPVHEVLTDFHNLLLVIITLIVLLVLGLLVYVMWRFNAKRNPVPSKTSHNTLIEVIWTVVPVIILVIIAVPSFKALYFMDRVENADMTIKVIGRQWYWEYQYPDHGDFLFASYMVPDEEIQPGQQRLLEVDQRVIVPVDTNIRILVTAGDVIHAFAVPALGIKIDAIPGRLNETWTRITEPGVYYGQCSEICGTGHGFMPIALEAVPKEQFEAWVERAKVEFAQNTGAPSRPAVQLAATPSAAQ